MDKIIFVREINNYLVGRYADISRETDFVLDVDSTLIESNKGDATYSYYCIIANIPTDGFDGKTAEAVVWHHNGRGNCERYIEDTKYGVNLRFVPCGQFEANAMYYPNSDVDLYISYQLNRLSERASCFLLGSVAV